MSHGDERFHAEWDEIAGATGLGGRHRVSGGSAERARVAVRKSVAAALGRITELDPALGRLLRDTVRTGTTFCYEPDPGRQVTWILDRETRSPVP